MPMARADLPDEPYMRHTALLPSEIYSYTSCSYKSSSVQIVAVHIVTVLIESSL